MGKFEMPQSPKEIPQKMTGERLKKALGDLDLEYTIETGDKDFKFKIIVQLPQEHISEKDELMKDAFLNDAYHTEFETEKILSLVRMIRRSRNLDCKIENTDKQYIVTAFKK